MCTRATASAVAALPTTAPSSRTLFLPTIHQRPPLQCQRRTEDLRKAGPARGGCVYRLNHDGFAGPSGRFVCRLVAEGGLVGGIQKSTAAADLRLDHRARIGGDPPQLWTSGSLPPARL